MHGPALLAQRDWRKRTRCDGVPRKVLGAKQGDIAYHRISPLGRINLSQKIDTDRDGVI